MSSSSTIISNKKNKSNDNEIMLLPEVICDKIIKANDVARLEKYPILLKEIQKHNGSTTPILEKIDNLKEEYPTVDFTHYLMINFLKQIRNAIKNDPLQLASQILERLPSDHPPL